MDHTGKPYTEVTNWILQVIDALGADAKKLHEIQGLQQKQPISVPTDTTKTSKTDKPTTLQTSKSTTKSQLISISQALTTAIQKDKGASGSPPPPSPLTPHHKNTPTTFHYILITKQNAFIKRQSHVLSSNYI